MNDEQDPQLDPEQEARVRALLADLGSARGGHPPAGRGPARRDPGRSGGRARGEADTSSTRSNVVPLRRRWAPRAAAAAAAVIVVAPAASPSRTSGSSVVPIQPPTRRRAGALEVGQSRWTAREHRCPARPVRCRTAFPLASRAWQPRRSTPTSRACCSAHASPLDATSERGARQGQGTGKSFAVSCPGPANSDGSRTTPVLLDGTPSALVVHPAHGGQQLVEAWTCTGDQLLDSTKVTARHRPPDQSSPGSPGLGSSSSSP